MDRLSPPYDFKASNLTATGEFVGYASTFGGPPDSFGDIVVNGAFAASLAKHAERKTAPALLWSHDAREPIGKITKLSEDANGLRLEGRLSLDTQRGREAHALMKDGALSMSIGFRLGTDGSRFDESGVRVLTKIDLWEVSVVAMPANPSAQITEVKSIPNIRAFEAELRDALGFSVRDARRLASGGWPALKGKAQPNENEIAELFRQSAKRFVG
jgi:uncharacterized protein